MSKILLKRIANKKALPTFEYPSAAKGCTVNDMILAVHKKDIGNSWGDLYINCIKRRQ